jgi:DNA repair photolyase
MDKKSRKSVFEASCKTILVSIDSHPLNWCIFPHRLVANAYVGCQHHCVYCYAKWYTRKGQITAKINAAERLKSELKKRIEKNKPKEPVCLGSISNPYQPIEQKYEITRKMLQVSDALSYPVFIVTKSDLVIRDIDILKSLAERSARSTKQSKQQSSPRKKQPYHTSSG